MSSTPLDLTSLFSRAAAAGTISTATQSILSGDLGSIVVAGAAGASLETITATDVTLVTVLIDASSSIASRGLEQAVREGEQQLVEAFAGSKEHDAILMALWTFDDDVNVVHSYVPVTDATRLDDKNYRGAGTTHLYDAWCDAIAANVAYAQTLRDGGTPCRSVVVAITDGEDCGSRRTAADCAALSKDVLASEQFVLAFVGVGGDVDFRDVARKMGVPAGCIAVQSDATPTALRATFQMVSRSAIRASQGKVQPGAATGFFAP